MPCSLPGSSCGSRPPGSAAAPARPATERRCPADPAAAIPAAGCRRGGRKPPVICDGLRVPVAQLGVGKALAQVVEQCRIVIARQNGANATLTLRHRQRPSARSPVVQVTTVAAPPRQADGRSRTMPHRPDDNSCCCRENRPPARRGSPCSPAPALPADVGRAALPRWGRHR